MNNQRAEEIAKTLGISLAEAVEVLQADQQIDKGEKLFELTPEQKKASKSARITTSGVYTFTKRERKPDLDKRELLDTLFQAVVATAESAEVVNPEREVLLQFHGRKFKITLSAPRS